MISFSSGFRAIGLVGVVLGAALGQIPGSAQTTEQKPKGFGVTVGAEASSQDVGLPFYPGAQVKPKSAEDSNALSFGIWGGGNGMKIAAAKLESKDSVEAITAFYRKALAKFGAVLECSHSTAKVDVGNEDAADAPVSCEDDSDQKGSIVLKTGINRNQHLVEIKKKDDKVEITLVAIATWQKKESQP